MISLLLPSQSLFPTLSNHSPDGGSSQSDDRRTKAGQLG